MTVQSLPFFFSAFIAALVYRKIPAKYANLWLLLVSAGFVATWSWSFLFALAVFVLVNYFIAIQIERQETKAARWSLVGIAVNIAFVFLFKYNNFYLPQLNHLLVSTGLITSANLISILVPVGLSFLLVQAISYLLDVKNKRLKVETNLVNLAVYFLYFPKLLSGPIERARTFLPRLAKPAPLNMESIERSAALILVGLFRKVVIADPLFNMIPNKAFLSPLDFSGQNLFFWLIAYSFALYNDFAGYTNIVRGVSLWFGIELTNNFNLPYYSRNFTEFWNRWHISLSNWLRDYIYFPLSRSLVKRFPQRTHLVNIVLPPLVTMLISGMWHGLAWNLVLWGGLHGLYQVVERIPTLWHAPTPLDERPKWRQSLGTALTFTFAALAWVPFRMPIPVALEYWKGLFLWKIPDLVGLGKLLFKGDTFSSYTRFDLPNPILLLLILLALVFDGFQHRARSEAFILGWPRVWVTLFVVILLGFSLLAVFSDQVAPFVYQAF